MYSINPIDHNIMNWAYLKMTFKISKGQNFWAKY